MKTSKIPPVLFIIFNRRDTALKSFDAIRHAKPSKLYIASDGPRVDRDGESAIVEATRNTILSAVDWPCEVKTLFREKNLGCGQGVYSAINWLFDNEEQGIILEDDCVASPTFFPYVEEMLRRYADDQRIGMIAGYNPIELKDYDYSVVFSRFKGCWGWATWRRAWKNRDIDMKWRGTDFFNSIIANSGYHDKDRSKWMFELKCIDNDVVSAWDWQWYFTLAAQNQLCIFPAVNQISNIGNDADATHTSFSAIIRPFGPLPSPYRIPPVFCPYEPFDNAFYKDSQTLHARLTRVIPPKIKDQLKRILK